MISKKSIFKLNQKGFSHHLIVPGIVVLLVAVIGVRLLLGSHADTPTLINTPPKNWVYVGYATLPFVNSPETVKAYACQNTFSSSSAEIKTTFILSNMFQKPFSYAGRIETTTPLGSLYSGWKYLDQGSTNVRDSVTMAINPVIGNDLSFQVYGYNGHVSVVRLVGGSARIYYKNLPQCPSS